MDRRSSNILWFTIFTDPHDHAHGHATTCHYMPAHANVLIISQSKFRTSAINRENCENWTLQNFPAIW